jgi:hypothetical protein
MYFLTSSNWVTAVQTEIKSVLYCNSIPRLLFPHLLMLSLPFSSSHGFHLEIHGILGMLIEVDHCSLSELVCSNGWLRCWKIFKTGQLTTRASILLRCLDQKYSFPLQCEERGTWTKKMITAILRL